MTISLKFLSEKQRRAWEMRYRRGWRMKRIALAMGVTPCEVSRLLKRAMLRAGVPWRRNARVLPVKPRAVRVVSLSGVGEV
jgi:DNA-directed RNA polymerase specialized sigma24 family protein